VRKAVGDSGLSQKLIRTITHKRLRFLGLVHTQPIPTSADTARSARHCGVSFSNMNCDPDHEYFSDGISEDILVA
jgi:hypothetical protein